MLRLLAVVGFGALGVGYLPDPTPSPPAPNPVPIASVQDILSTAVYNVRTVLAGPNRTTVERTTPGVLAVPTLVDVDAPTLLPVPDLTVTVLPRLPLGLGLTIARAPLAQARPVRVEVEFTLPTAGNRIVSFGYDARRDRNPQNFDANVQFGIQPGSTDLGLTTTITEVPSTLDLVAALFSRAAGGSRVDPIDVSLNATPVPNQLGAIARFTPGLADFGSADDRTVDADYTASTVFHAVAKASVVKGNDTTVVDVDVPALPSKIDATYRRIKSADRTEITLDPEGGVSAATATLTNKVGAATVQAVNVAATGIPSHNFLTIDGDTLGAGAPTGYPQAAGREAFTWDANGPVTKLDIRYDRTDGVNTPVHFDGIIEQLPPKIKATFDKVGTAPASGAPDTRDLVVTAEALDGGAVGRIDAGFAQSGAIVPRLTDVTTSYASIATTPALRAAARLDGVTFAKIDTRDPLVADVRTNRAQPMEIRYASPKLSIGATLKDLPTTSLVTIDSPNLAADPKTTLLGYTGSAPISNVTAALHTVGASGRAADARLTLAELPAQFTATMTDGPGQHHKVVWDASSKAGLVDAVADTTNSEGAPVHLEARVESLPQDLTLAFDRFGPVPAPGAKDERDTVLEMTAGEGQSVGMVRAGLAVGRDVTVPFRDDLDAYAVMTRDDGGTGTAARITDLTHLLVDTRDPLVVDVDMARALKFVVAQATPQRTIDATIKDLPASALVRVDSPDPAATVKTTAVHYDGSAVIDSIDGTVGVVAANGSRFDGTLGLARIPTALDLTLTDDDPADKTTLDIVGTAGLGLATVDGVLRPAGKPQHKLNATLTDLPASANLIVDNDTLAPGAVAAYPKGADRQSAIWHASGPIGRVVAALDTTNADGPFHLDTTIDKLPPDLTLTLDKPGPKPASGPDTRPVVVDALVGAGQHIDTLEAHVILGSASAPALTAPDGAAIATTASGTGVTARVHGLTHLGLDTGDPLVVDATLAAPLRFAVNHAAPGRIIDATLADLPATAKVRIDSPDKDATAKTTAVTFVGSAPIASVVGDVRIVDENDKTTNATVKLADLPLRFGATITAGPGDHNEVKWSASGPARRIDAVADTTNSEGDPVHLEALIEQLPPELTVLVDRFGAPPAAGQPDTRDVVIDARSGEGQSVGVLQAGFMSGTGMTIPYGKDAAYATIERNASGAAAAAARITGLERLLVDTRDPLVLDVGLAKPLPFVVSEKTPTRTLNATIANLPTSALIKVDAADPAAAVKSTAIHYEGAAVIASIRGGANVVAANGNRFDGTFDLAQVPTRLDVTLSDNANEARKIIDVIGSTGFASAKVVGTFEPRGKPVTRFDAAMFDLPAAGKLTVDNDVIEPGKGDVYPNGAERQSAVWEANGPIGRIVAAVDTTNASGGPLHFDTTIEGLPDDLAVTIDKAGAQPREGERDGRATVIDVATGNEQAIDVLDVHFSTDGGSIPELKGADGAVVVSDPRSFAATARVHGLTHFGLDTRDPLVLDVGLRAPIPFAVDASLPGRTIKAAIADLATESLVRVDAPGDGDEKALKTTVVHYEGGDVIRSITGEIHTVNDAGDAFDGTFALQQVPTTMDLTITDDSPEDRLAVDFVNSDTLGQATVTGTMSPASGPRTTITATVNGLPSEGHLIVDGDVLAERAEEAYPEGAERQRAMWRANGATQSVLAVVDTTSPSGEPVHLDTTLTRVPADMVVTVDKPGPQPRSGEVDARPPVVSMATGKDQSIETVEAHFTTNNAPIPALRPTDGAVVSDLAAGMGVTARVHGLSSLVLDTRDPLVLDVSLARELPFFVDYTAPAKAISATIINLPTHALVKIDSPDPAAAVKRTVLHYNGDAVISSIAGRIHTLASDGATFDGTYNLTGLPTVVDATITDDDAADRMAVDFINSAPLGLASIDGTLRPAGGKPPVELFVKLTGVPSEGHLVVDTDLLAPGAEQAYPQGAERLRATWTANGPITKLETDIDTTNAKGEHLHLDAVVNQIPDDLTVTVDKAGPQPATGVPDDRQVVLDALSSSGHIQSVDAHFFTGTNPQPAVTDPDGVTILTKVSGFGAAAKAHGIGRFTLDTRDPLVVSAQLAAPLRFVVKQSDLKGSVDATITNMPVTSLLRLDRPDKDAAVKTTIVHWEGSDPIGAIDATVNVATATPPIVATVNLTNVPVLIKELRYVDNAPDDVVEIHYDGGPVPYVHGLVTAGDSVIDATLEGLPTRVDVVVDRDDVLSTKFAPGSTTTNVVYDANGSLNRLFVERTKGTKRMRGELLALPTHVEVFHHQDKPPFLELAVNDAERPVELSRRINVVASGGIGTTDVAVVESGTLPDIASATRPGIVRVTPGASRLVLPALRKVHVVTGKTMAVRLELDPTMRQSLGVDFNVLTEVDTVLPGPVNGHRTFAGTIDDLPRLTKLLIDTAAGRVQYHGIAPISVIDVTASSPAGELLSDQEPFNRTRNLDALINDLPRSVGIEIGELSDGGEGLKVSTFDQAQFDAGDPLLPSEQTAFGSMVIPPVFTSSPIGKVDLSVASSPEVLARPAPAVGVVFEDVTQHVRLVVRVPRLRQAVLSTAEATTANNHTETTTTVGLIVGPPPTPNATTRPTVIVDVPLDTFPNAPAADKRWSRTEVTLFGELPTSTDVILKTVSENQNEDQGDNIVDPLTTTSEVTFATAPSGIAIRGYRHTSVDDFGDGQQQLANRSQFQLIDISAVPTFLRACSSSRLTGVCTTAPGRTIDLGQTSVSLKNRAPGSSTGIVARGRLLISRFVACDKGCAENDFRRVDSLPSTQEVSETATFTRIYGLDIPAAPITGDNPNGTSRFEMDSYAPTLDNGCCQPDHPTEVGSIWFDTDGGIVTIGAGESQTINDDTCSNREDDPSRIGIGGLTSGLNKNPFQFHSQNRGMLFYVRSVDFVGNRCRPSAVNPFNHLPESFGALTICSGEVVPDSLGFGANLASLNQELDTTELRRPGCP